jgi:hypothetical protein
MGQTWFASNILEPFIIFGFCSESNPIVNAFSRKFFRILLREQSNRQRVLTHFFSTIKGKSTEAIHMDAPPFIIALSF